MACRKEPKSWHQQFKMKMEPPKVVWSSRLKFLLTVVVEAVKTDKRKIKVAPNLSFQAKQGKAKSLKLMVKNKEQTKV